MTRAWALILCLVGASGLCADTPPAPLPDMAPALPADPAPAPLPALTPALPAATVVETPVDNSGAARWETVTLFDWLYSGEKPYEVLKRAAEGAGDQGWIAKRLEQGEKVPQASARELAYKLASTEGLDPDLRAQLKDLFADETRQLGASAQDAVAAQATQLDSTLVAASEKLDELEASAAKNTYGKGSSTGVTLNLYSGYRVDDPTGAVQGQEHTYTAGGMEAALAGSVGKVNYNFTLSAEYYYNNLLSGGPDGILPAYPVLAEAADVDSESDQGTMDAGASFQFPLGNRGGLDVSLGAIQNVELSPLLFASIEPINRDAFFVDVLTPYRAPKIIKTMEMNYPAATFNFRGLYLVKAGSDWYWPFDSTQFIYTPFDQTYYQTWDAKLYSWALRLDENLNARGDWFDGGLVYGMVQGASNDYYQMIGAGAFPNPLDNTDPLIMPQTTQSFGLGTQLRGSSGAIVHLDAAASSYDWNWGDVSQNYSGTAFIATVAQPVGAFNFALQAGQASPYFLSSPRVENRIQNGATQDSIANVYSPNGVDVAADYETPVPTKPPAVSWISMMNQPDVLSNNNNQLALKGEWHGSWISVGGYDGAQMQINPTEAYVWTTPYIEGNQDDGYGWFRVFGNSFAAGSPSALVTPGQLGGLEQQILFNQKTYGTAHYGAGQSMNVNWQQMAQYGNYETEFITLLSQKGVGDENLMANTAKSLNYVGTNLLFDFGALMERSRPLQLTVIGEDRDLNTLPGLPSLGGTDLFNQQFEVADLNWGLSDTLTILGTAGYETWKTEQSYYPVNMQITEFGVGADLNEDPLVTGLVFNLRASVMSFEDLNFASRDFSLMTLSLGSTLSY